MQNGQHCSPVKASPQHVPLLLRTLPRWVRWKLQTNAHGKVTKVPDCSTADRTRWRTFDDACAAGAIAASEGIGFCTGGRVESPRGLVVALDYDNCRNPRTGELSEWAARAMRAFGNSYTEVSPSGAGVRQFLLVKHLPDRLPRSRIAVEAAPAVPESEKQVEVQLFGVNPNPDGGGYVTVTGAWLEHTARDLARLSDLDAVFRHFGVSPDEAAAPLGELPTGEGAAPAAADVAAAVQREAPDLAAGRWQALGHPSASEGYFSLAQIALRAARGHGQPVVDFLLDHTPWGRGGVESHDPHRYTSEAKVVREVCRIAGKTRAHVSADALDALTDAEADALVPDDSRERAGTSGNGLSMPAAAWVETVGALRFIIRDFWPAQGTSLTIGAPGCGKSQMLLSLAYALTTGAEAWFGMPIERHGAVLFIVGEGRHGFANRIRAEAKRRGGRIPDRLHVSVKPASLDDPRQVAAWVKHLAAQIPDLVMIVVDTLTSNTSGEFEENDVRGMKGVLEHGARISDHAGCHVAFVHHTGYQNPTRGRGSSAQKGAVDCDFLVTKVEKEAVADEEAVTSGGDALEITFAPDRTKDWPQGAPVVGSVRSIVVDDEGTTAPVIVEERVRTVELTGGDEDADAVFRVIVEAEGAPLRRDALQERTGLSEWRLKRAVERLSESYRWVTSAKAGRLGQTYDITPEGLSAARNIRGFSADYFSPVVSDLLC